MGIGTQNKLQFVSRRVALPAVLLMGAMSVARGADWPQWRGAVRDGVWREAGIPESFPPKGPAIVWRVPCGHGWSSPVIVGGRVYLTDSELKQSAAKERIHCFDEATGQTLWTHAYAVNYPEWVFVPEQGAGPTSTPVVHEGRLYAVGANGHVHCLDAKDGSVIWERDLAKDYTIRVMQCRPSPLIDGSRLIVCVGGKPGACVIALDKLTGREIWHALDEMVSNSSPLVIRAGGARQLIFWTDESVSSLDPESGKVWWREPMTTSNNDSIPSPLVEGNRLLISGLMFRLDPEKPAASIHWPGVTPATRRNLSNTSTALFRGRYIYSVRTSGEFVCLDADTGRELWTTNSVTELHGGASVHITPCGDGVFLFTDRGDLVRARLSPGGYRETGRAHLLEPTSRLGSRKCAWVPPSYANGHVFARNDEELVCASLKKGGEAGP